MNGAMRRRGFLAGLLTSAAVVADSAPLTLGNLARLRPARGAPPTPPGYISSWTTPSGRSTVFFDKPVKATTFDGQLIFEKDATANIIAWTPACALIPTSTPGVSRVAYGVQADPYMPYSEQAPRLQGVEELLQYMAGTPSGANMNYVNTLNVAPFFVDARFSQSNGAISCATARSWVKSIRRTGIINNPTAYRVFDEHVLIHCVDSLPSQAIFPPSPSWTTKRTDYLLSDADIGVLGPGYGYSSGQITLAESMPSVGIQYMASSVQPYFGNYGEINRPWQISEYLGPSWNGYAREVGIYFGDVLLGMLAEGPATPRWIFERCVCVGLQQFGLYEMGYRAGSGAGQWAGYWPLMFLAAMALRAKDPTLIAKVLAYKSDETDQQFFARDYFVGNAVYDGEFNHGIQHRTITQEDVGVAFFHLGFPSRPNPPDKKTDGNVDTDYELNAAGVANFPGIVACMGMYGVADLAGKKGDQVIAGADNYSTEFSAVVAYQHRQNTFVNNNVTIYASGNNIIKPRHQAFFRSRLAANSFGLPAPQIRPESGTPNFPLRANFYFPTPGVDGSVSWNLAGLDGGSPDVLPILEYQIRYTVDFIQMFSVDTPGVTGAQGGLNPNRVHYFQHRRRNSVGWSPWSNIMKRQWDSIDPQYQDPFYPTEVQPTGTDNGVPVCTRLPQVCTPLYPEWYGFGLDRPCETPYDYHHSRKLRLGEGYWSGLWTVANTVVAIQRDGADTAVTRQYTLQPPDLATNQRIRVTVGGVSTAYSLNVAIPDRAPPPAGYIIYAPVIDDGFPLDYWEFWESLQANSRQSTTNAFPLNPVIDTNSQFDASYGIMSTTVRGPKSQAQPKLRSDLSLGQGVSGFTPGVNYSYRVGYQIGRGLPDTDRAYAVNGLFRIGTVIDGTQYRGSVSLTRTGQPYQSVVTGAFTATGAVAGPGWMFLGVPTSDGSAPGGDPCMSSLIVYPSSVPYPP